MTLYITRDRDGQLSVHNHMPFRDEQGYWLTSDGETDSLSACRSDILRQLLAPAIRHGVPYDSPVVIEARVEELGEDAAFEKLKDIAS